MGMSLWDLQSSDYLLMYAQFVDIILLQMIDFLFVIFVKTIT